MGIAASFLICAAAASQAGGHQAPKASASGQPIAVQAQATARILTGAEIRFGRGDQRAEVASTVPPQITRDRADLQWVEFS